MSTSSNCSSAPAEGLFWSPKKGNVEICPRMVAPLDGGLASDAAAVFAGAAFATDGEVRVTAAAPAKIPSVTSMQASQRLNPSFPIRSRALAVTGTVS